ncbi:translation initiation factor IF-2-like [Sphaerodactylus townsendi]|uniref:translation initiation factor IF-2-like n=1 Tax=Sphaerodactylus townsendi TaxID=933632 RepID=UPI00202619A1|nr:translation initiation factor IF-2-like [Sphaerodactylus townsendi]XP_048362703.1 translation initiation factor IF-2-like [Sphaerodactylus townsendi]XP_048362704.1 translation initiation factor IF-2-like [Sphaerodactylus townsendi]XP_048362705.1 translation initiation factor IF-2-like [Sphaerodactylus townsendi]XP_048362706.1 translation initiation factor IF-2-like [Sphaerodactylus townsendi]XP_048362707.1 translation initiation factor IF-2-like [Sphaerodactylus townsendi]
MGRPRKTADNVSSPRPAATAPKAAPAAPRASASSKSTPATTRAPSAPATKSEGSRRGQGKVVASISSSDGRGQSYQPKSADAYGSGQGDVKSSRGARAKTSAASGGGGYEVGTSGIAIGSFAYSSGQGDVKSSRGARAKTSAASGGGGYEVGTSGIAMASSARPSQTATKKQGKASDFSPPLDVAEIESKTRGQRTNPEWYKWRENRITASMAPKIANSNFANGRSSEVPQSYLKNVVNSRSGVVTPAMSWGLQNEKKAIQAYKEIKSSKSNKPLTVDDCGLYIDKEKSWLAASPDGIVREARTGKQLAVLEVKCPYKHRDKTVTDACKDKNFCLEKEGDSYMLKKSHPYYTQVQCQMGVTGLKKADFVVHTNKETAVAPVDFDPVFWDATEPKLEKFYKDAVVPYLEQNQNAAAWAKEE